MISVRDFQPSDLPAIRQLFYNTVTQVNCQDYSPEQIQVWSASAQDDALWHNRWDDHCIYVAEDAGQIVGFAELVPPEEHIDCFYCHHQYQGKGVGSQLLNHLETTARSLNLQRLWAEVSITAKPFFLRKGFTVVRSQFVERQGVQLQNFVMEKLLD
ncbi:MAG: GNAT family N-acetyltransferase [Elainellaceae cyanobacterium]